MVERARATTAVAAEPTCVRGALSAAERRQLLIALMLPQAMVVVNLSAMGVALPAIRETFNAPADLVAWVVTAYTLPYVALMPLYGRLGDDLGIRRMLLTCIGVFLAGTTLNSIASSLPLLLLGRFIQGAGASGAVPLAIALISRVFPEETRGRALGQWNSVGPVASVAGSLLSGILIDAQGWHSIFLVVLLAGGAALVLVGRSAKMPAQHLQLDSLQTFDWGGVLLFSATLTALLFYLTSRSITGYEALTDWRLLTVTIALGAAFILYERCRPQPFIDLSLLLDANLARTCLSSATRMFVMASTGFLIPLFLTDLGGLSATAIGSMLMIRSAALFPTMYYGGRVADRLGSRRPIVIGLTGQAASVLLFIIAGAQGGVSLVAVGLFLNGLSAGLALPALHRSAMEGNGDDRGGAAAGVYSMIRFWGQMLGTAVAGVLLQTLLDRGTPPLASYRLVYGATILVGAIGVLSAATMREGQLSLTTPANPAHPSTRRRRRSRPG